MTGRPRTVAVVGGGRMGSGIAHAFLVAGSQVEVRDVTESAVAAALRVVEDYVDKTEALGALSEPRAAVLARLATRVGTEQIGDVDLVVEAVPEIPALKAAVLGSVAASVPSTTLIATNTSSISVTELGAAVSTPERFLGMHFFNPVPASRLVELVGSPATARDVLDSARTWVTAIGKRSIVVADAPGFATSRLGLAIGLEAIRMLESGVASAEDIDAGMTLGYGFPVGPLRLTDIVGLDVRLEIAEHLEKTLGPRFTPPELLRQHVAEGRLGRKSGRGFYEWPR